MSFAAVLLVGWIAAAAPSPASPAPMLQPPDLKQLTSERLERYLAYWKAVGEGGDRLFRGESKRKPEKQRDLTESIRLLREQSAQDAKLTQAEIASLDRVVDAFLADRARVARADEPTAKLLDAHADALRASVRARRDYEGGPHP